MEAVEVVKHLEAVKKKKKKKKETKPVSSGAMKTVLLPIIELKIN